MLQKTNLEPICAPWSISGGCCPPSCALLQGKALSTWLSLWSWKAQKQFIHILLILENKGRKGCRWTWHQGTDEKWKLTIVGGASHISWTSLNDKTAPCCGILGWLGLRKGRQDGDEGDTPAFPAVEVCDCENPPRDKSQCLRKERLWVLIWKFPFLYADNILRRVKIGIAIPSLTLSLWEQLFYRSSWWKNIFL